VNHQVHLDAIADAIRANCPTDEVCDALGPACYEKHPIHAMAYTRQEMMAVPTPDRGDVITSVEGSPEAFARIAFDVLDQRGIIDASAFTDDDLDA
jgi:hypothetical protein